MIQSSRNCNSLVVTKVTNDFCRGEIAALLALVRNIVKDNVFDLV